MGFWSKIMVVLKYFMIFLKKCGGEKWNKNSKVDNWRKLKYGYVEVNYIVFFSMVFENVYSEKVKINKIFLKRKKINFWI